MEGGFLIMQIEYLIRETLKGLLATGIEKICVIVEPLEGIYP